MIATLKRLLPWMSGLFSFLAWRAGRALWAGRRTPSDPVRGPVCVIQIGSLGDVLMVTPLLQSLVSRFGAGQVDVVVSSRTAHVVRPFPGLRDIIRVKRPFRWRDPTSVLEFIRIVKILRARRYGAIFDTSRVIQSAWMAFLASPHRSAGPRLPRPAGPLVMEQLGYLYTDEIPVHPHSHMIRQNLALLKPFEIHVTSETLTFTPTPEDDRAAHEWLFARGVRSDQPYVVVHPGAKWPPKRWHADRFRALAAQLQASGLRVVLAGDWQDRALAESIAREIAPSPLVMAGELELSAVAALIRRARLFIGNDSALMHLASAQGTPIVALFGPTFPERTGPLGPPHYALVKPIGCRPCRLYFTRERCERGHNYCMDLIAVDEVWAAAQSLLTVSRSGGTT